jgi:LysR family hydrogen peroxide-inducible transcriptional activator
MTIITVYNNILLSKGVRHMLSISYKYVLAVANYRNMTKAAASLCITQPALTKYINRLEQELGVTLFNRKSNPITLTTAGYTFVEKASVIAELEDSLLRDFDCKSTNIHGSFTCGLTPEFADQVLPYVLPNFKKRYPNIDLHLVTGDNQRLMDLIQDRTIELAIVTHIPNDSSITFETLLTDPIILAIPISHPVAQSFDLSTNSPFSPYFLNASKIRNADFVICPPGLGIGEIEQDMFSRHKITPKIVTEIGKNETALKIASTGLGMTFCPVKTPLRIQLIHPMAYFSLDNPIYIRRRGYCHLKARPLTKQAAYFIDILQKAVNTESIFSNPICQLIFEAGK